MKSTRGIDPDMAPRDIAHLVQALLEGIERGELQATAKEVDFLASVAQLLDQPARAV